MAYQLNKTYLLFCDSGIGQCLSVSGGIVANHQAVCIGTKDGGAAQSRTIKQFGSNYKIVSNLNQNYALNYYGSSGQDSNCDIYPQSGNDTNSSIVLEPISTGVYRIKLKNYNLYLTIDDNATKVSWETPVSMGSDYQELRTQEWRIVDPAEKGIRAPFIYAGFHRSGEEYTYTDAQISGLNNATEFVICSGSFENYFTEDGEPNVKEHETKGYIQQYVEKAADMAQCLYTKYHKQVWIGTPVVGKNVTSKAAFAEVGRRMTYFIDNITTQFGIIGLDFNTVVKGIYMSDESVIDEFTASSEVADSPQISMFQTVSNYAAKKGKKMLWSPHWGPVNLPRAACVIHRTNIFDYALIQPGYYFNATGADLTCESVRTAIAIQRVIYQIDKQTHKVQPILHESSITCTKTVIGCQMEIDSNYNKDSAFKARYKVYTDVFDQSAGAYDKYNANFGFYFGCPEFDCTDDRDYNAAKAMVNDFFG